MITVQTLNLGLFVQWHETIRSRWRLVRRLLRRVEEGQQHGCQLLTHFLGVEVGLRPLVCVVAAGVFGERAGTANGFIAGVERCVYDESAVEDKEGVVDALEGVVVDSFIGEVNEHLRGGNERKGMLSRDYRIKVLTSLFFITPKGVFMLKQLLNSTY